MTARAKGRRQKNAAIKREKNKIKELQRLRKLVGKMDTDDLTDHNTVNVVQYERRVSVKHFFSVLMKNSKSILTFSANNKKWN